MMRRRDDRTEGAGELFGELVFTAGRGERCHDEGLLGRRAVGFLCGEKTRHSVVSLDHYG